MTKWMDGVLARYGSPARLQNQAGETALQVIFHPVSSSAWQNMQRIFSPLGEVPRGKYFCVLPASAPAAPEDTLVVGGSSYLLRRVEKVLLCADVMYQWALCVEKGSDTTWPVTG